MTNHSQQPKGNKNNSVYKWAKEGTSVFLKKKSKWPRGIDKIAQHIDNQGDDIKTKVGNYQKEIKGTNLKGSERWLSVWG